MIDGLMSGTRSSFEFYQQRWALTGAAVLLAFAVPVFADPAPPAQDWTRTETREDCTNYNPLRQPLFGDTHVHTKYSGDAVLARTRNTPYDAYNFAKGGTVGLPPYDVFDVPSRTATIEKPLDFTAVTDHSETLGETSICLNPGYPGYDDTLCQNLRYTLANTTYHPTNPLPSAFTAFFIQAIQEDPQRLGSVCGGGPAYADCLAEAGIIWQDIQDAAEASYDRTSDCSFTSFVAYEWSGNTGGNNLHRNVIFRNAEVPPLPISYFEKWKAEDLRTELKSQCLDHPTLSTTNCDVLAIPHNSNTATDKMFWNKTTDGAPLTTEYAELRASIERLMELTQVKGDSECRNGVTGTTDELCSYEKLYTANIFGTPLSIDSAFSPYAYARGALNRGLRLEKTLGVNPFALGFIGSTDTHNATSGATSERDYGKIGQIGIADSSPAFILAQATNPVKVATNPGGLAVVWAEENSRDSIFAAMRRRETYSTSGTRPILRTFGGRLRPDLCSDNTLDFAAEGYDKGVPMGGDIGPERGKFSPRFAVLAQKDPGAPGRVGTPLQRAQIIKGWVDSDGESHEKVYDVAGDPNNGAGVDLDTCEETNPQNGFDSLCAVWEDPEFDPSEPAYYYVRVVEDPVCRWHHRLCTELKTCSIQLTSCSLDPTRTCTTDADCEAHDAGSTCTVPYPAICTRDSDCAVLGAGTCGSTPAVDCNSPSTVPPGAVECCDMKYPWTIQERAVASPIYYHPQYVGITKGKIGFKDVGAGEDHLQLALTIPASPAALNPAANDLVLTLRSGATTVWSATIPAGTMEVKKPGAKYQYKDKNGTIGGITGLNVSISSKGQAKVQVKTGKVNLDAITRASQKLSLDVASGTYSSTADREWAFKAPNLSAVTF